MRSFPRIYSGARSVYIPDAYQRIGKYYRKGKRLLTSEEPDLLRLKIAADDIQFNAMPFVRDLQKMSIVPKRWIKMISLCCVEVEEELRRCIVGLERSGVDDAR